MKKFVTLLVTLLVIASLSFCAVAEEKPFAGQTLTISTFSFNAELLQKNVYDPFEAATGAKLVVDTGRNPERVTKIVESPEDYDVVIIGDMFVDQLREAGVLQAQQHQRHLRERPRADGRGLRPGLHLQPPRHRL